MIRGPALQRVLGRPRPCPSPCQSPMGTVCSTSPSSRRFRSYPRRAPPPRRCLREFLPFPSPLRGRVVPCNWPLKAASFPGPNALWICGARGLRVGQLRPMLAADDKRSAVGGARFVRQAPTTTRSLSVKCSVFLLSREMVLCTGHWPMLISSALSVGGCTAGHIFVGHIGGSRAPTPA